MTHSGQTKRRPQGRANKGHVLELPICVFMLVLMFFLPVADLCVSGLGTVTAFAAARSGASVAARCESFAEDKSARNTSAKHAAIKTATKVIERSLKGTRLLTDKSKVYLIGVPVKSGGSPIRQEMPLAETDTQNYVYQIEVVVVAEVQPLVTLNPELFGKIPGMTCPYTVTASCREYAEHYKGLTK